MNRLSLPKMHVAAFLLVFCVTLVFAGASFLVAPRAYADASVQNVKVTSASDGTSAQISFTGTANTDYVITFFNIESPPPPLNAHTGDNGDGTGNASVTAPTYPGAVYTFSIEPPSGQTTTRYTFLSENPVKVNVENVNVTTADNGSSVQISFLGTADYDYTVSVQLDLSATPYNVHTDGTGNASVTVNGLKPSSTYTFFIKRVVNGQVLTSDAYNFTTYQASGSVQNVVVSYTIDTSVTSFVDRIAKVSFTGTANTKYSLATIFPTTSLFSDVSTGDNGDGTGNATAFLSSLGSTLNNGSPTYSFQIQLNGQPDSDVYAFTFNS